MVNQKKMITFALEINGAMLEWLKRHAWKACIRQKRIPSSNLGRSAKVFRVRDAAATSLILILGVKPKDRKHYAYGRFRLDRNSLIE